MRQLIKRRDLGNYKKKTYQPNLEPPLIWEVG